MNKLFLTYTITNQTTKEIYFIAITEKDSKIKAKNVLSKVVFNRLMDVMNITDSALIESNKVNTIKSIKKAIYEISSNTQEGYKSIEVTGNIANVDNKEMITLTYINSSTGEETKKEVEGNKYNSKILPNLDLYIIKNSTGYTLTEKSTGACILSMRVKTPAKIELMLLDRNVKEDVLLTQIAKLNNKNVSDNIEVVVETPVIKTLEVIQETNQIISTTQTPKPLMIPNQSIIYTHDNIAIHAELEDYTSNISGQQYKQINYITIVKDNLIYFEGYRMGFPLNPLKEYNIINFADYQEYICKYIIAQENNNIDDYWTKITLTKLIQDMSTTDFDYIIKSMKKKEIEIIKDAEQQDKQNKIDSILSEIEIICNDKKLILYKDYSNIIIIKNSEYFDKKDRIIPVLKSFMDSCNDDSKIDYDKYFKQYELCNISLYNSNALELLQDAKKLIS